MAERLHYDTSDEIVYRVRKLRQRHDELVLQSEAGSESGDRLLLVDQHAAHERMLYDRLMERFEKGTVSQQLLSPQLVRLTAHDRALVSEFAPVLADAGFEVEPFDDTCVAVKAIPTLFGENESPRELLLEALDEWQAGRGQVTRERMRRRVAQMKLNAVFSKIMK